MQENTVLLLTPLCIDSDTAFRHCRECIFLRAGIIDVPSFEYISGRSMRCIGFVSIIGSCTGPIRNAARCTDLSHAGFCQRGTITVNILAIHKVDGVCVAGIVAIDVSCIAVIPYGIQLRSIVVVCFRRICSAALAEADKINIVFCFCEEAVLCIDRLVFDEAHPVIGSLHGLAGQRLHIVMDRLGGSVGNVQMERYVCRRHDVDVNDNFAVWRIALRIPAFAVIVCGAIVPYDWEIAGDVLLI